jgi:hypothetical protein
MKSDTARPRRTTVSVISQHRARSRPGTRSVASSGGWRRDTLLPRERHYVVDALWIERASSAATSPCGPTQRAA